MNILSQDRTGAARFLASALLLAGAGSALAEVHYVDLNSTNATPPYTNWATAATNIQDAVDAAVAGDEIVVTNGVYASGGGNGNRVEVAKAVSLHSIDGPQVTVISGTNSSGRPENRCVYLANSARLSGFALSGGVGGDVNSGASCLNCESVTAVASNCIISACSGGAASGGTLNHCTLSGNSASDNDVTDSGGTVDRLVNNCLYFANFHEVFSRLFSKRFYRARLR